MADGTLDLPAELLLLTLSMLPPANVLRCRGVCQRWRHLASDALLWDRHLDAADAYSFNFWPPASLAAFGASIRRYSCWDGADAERYDLVSRYGAVVDTEHQVAVVRSIAAAGGVLGDVKLDVRAFARVRNCLTRCRTVRLFDIDWLFVRDLAPMPSAETVQLVLWHWMDADNLRQLFPNLRTLHLTSTRQHNDLPSLPSGLDRLHVEKPWTAHNNLMAVLADVALPPRTIVLTLLESPLTDARNNTWVDKLVASAWWPRVVELSGVRGGVRHTVRRTDKEIAAL
jgi:hypothetical protein